MKLKFSWTVEQVKVQMSSFLNLYRLHNCRKYIIYIKNINSKIYTVNSKKFGIY